MPISRLYNSTNSAGVGADHASLPEDLEGLLFNGIMGSGSSNVSVEPSCPTGNCSFPTLYSTLGVCSSCKNSIYDVKVHLQLSEDAVSVYVDGDPARVNITRLVSLYELGPLHETNQSLTLQQPGYFYDSDKNLMRVWGNTVPVANFPAPMFANVSVLTFTDRPCTTDWISNGSVQAQRKNPASDCLIPSTVLASAASEQPPTPSGLPPSAQSIPIDQWNNVTSAQCQMTLCMKNYHTTVTAGKSNETLVSTADAVPMDMDDIDAHSNMSTSYRVIANPCIIDGVAHDLSGALAAGNQSIHKVRQAASDPALVDQCTYTIDTNSFDDISSFLSYFFSGNGSSSAWSNDVPVALDGQMNSSRVVPVYEPIWLEPLYNNASASLDSLNATMAAVAGALTDYIRRNDFSSAVAPGLVYATQTCVQAQYQWLALPMALEVAACLFLIGLMVRSAHSNLEPARKVWKSNVLGVLFHGSEFETRAVAAETRTSLITEPENMDKAAKSIDAQLVETQHGWQFVQAYRGPSGRSLRRRREDP